MPQATLGRLLSFITSLSFAACSSPGGTMPSDTPTFELEILSPQAGQTRAWVKYRIRYHRVSLQQIHIAPAQRPNSPLTNQALCIGPNGIDECEGTLAVPPSTGDFEVWADYMRVDESESGQVRQSPRQTVSLNSMPIVLAQLSASPTSVTWLVTGQNNLDRSTLGTVRVSRVFSSLPYQGSPESATLGQTIEDVPVTVSHMGNRLTVTGAFNGPAAFTFTLEGITNEFGTPVPNREVGVGYFGLAQTLTDRPSSGAGTATQFARARDGQLYFLSESGLSRLEGGAVTSVVSWSRAERGAIDLDGVPYTSTANASTGVAQVSKWTGAAWEALPPVSVPVEVAATYQSSLGFDGANTPFLMVGRYTSFPNIEGIHIYRLQGGTWSEVASWQFGDGVRQPRIGRFGTGLAFSAVSSPRAMPPNETLVRRFSGSSWTNLPSPDTGLGALGSHVDAYDFSQLQHDAAGAPMLLAQYEDATQYAAAANYDSPFIRFAGVAILKWSGTAWVVHASGNPLVQGWVEPRPLPAPLYTNGFFAHAWALGVDDSITLVTDERRGGQTDNMVRFSSGYRLSEGKWRPLPGCPTPLLDGGPLTKAGVSSNGQLWTLGTATGGNYVLLRH